MTTRRTDGRRVGRTVNSGSRPRTLHWRCDRTNDMNERGANADTTFCACDGIVWPVSFGCCRGMGVERYR